jgi:hypothetical protein
MAKNDRDYLKYWRVVRQFIKVKYGLTQSDLDILLFMYSESYFTRDRFQDFNRLVSWDRLRFDRLLKQGYFEVFRGRIKNRGKIYQMTEKSKMIVNIIYDKLEGKKRISTTKSNNPMYLASARHRENVYKDMITEMNAFIQQQQRPPLE